MEPNKLQVFGSSTKALAKVLLFGLLPGTALYLFSPYTMGGFPGGNSQALVVAVSSIIFSVILLISWKAMELIQLTGQLSIRTLFSRIKDSPLWPLLPSTILLIISSYIGMLFIPFILVVASMGGVLVLPFYFIFTNLSTFAILVSGYMFKNANKKSIGKMYVDFSLNLFKYFKSTLFDLIILNVLLLLISIPVVLLSLIVFRAKVQPNYLPSFLVLLVFLPFYFVRMFNFVERLSRS